MEVIDLPFDKLPHMIKCTFAYNVKRLDEAAAWLRQAGRDDDAEFVLHHTVPYGIRQVSFISIDPPMQAFWLHFKWHCAQSLASAASPRTYFNFFQGVSEDVQPRERVYEDINKLTWHESNNLYVLQTWSAQLKKLVVLANSYSVEDRFQLFFYEPWLLPRPYFEMSNVMCFDGNERNLQRRNLSEKVGKQKKARLGRLKTDRQPAEIYQPLDYLREHRVLPPSAKLSQQQADQYAQMPPSQSIYYHPTVNEEDPDLKMARAMGINLDEPQKSNYAWLHQQRTSILAKADEGTPQDERNELIAFLNPHCNTGGFLDRQPGETDEAFDARVYKPSMKELKVRIEAFLLNK